MTETKIVELIIQDENQELAIDAISLVTSPAIEQDFVFFGKEKNNLTFAKVDEEKRMLVSPALIPNKQIFRHDPNTDSDYYVYFSKDTVRKASELYLKHNNHHKATYQHQDRVSGVLTVESWIIEDTKLDKSTLYGYSLPVGTWMVKLSISNDEIWSKIKSGELKGLSIEGYFTNKFEQMQKTKPTTEQILSAFNELVREGKITTMSKAKKLSLAKKFELADIKSLKSLEAQLDKIISNITDTESAVKKSVDNYEEKNVANKDAIEKVDLSFDDYQAQQKKIADETKLLDKLEGQYLKLDKAQDKTASQKEKFAQAVFKQTDKYESSYKKGESISDKLENEIKEVKKAAKALGVDIPLGSYEQAVDKFNNISSEPLRSINFDY